MDLIKVNEIVQDTYTNQEGFKLYTKLKVYLDEIRPVAISFMDTTPLSSSFFNSSFGEVIDKHGINVFKDLIKIRDITKSQAEQLRNYIKTHQDLVS
jgi:hypothetical protein